jgi:hypothetical protein
MRRSKSSDHYTHKECKWCNKGGKKDSGNTFLLQAIKT